MNEYEVVYTIDNDPMNTRHTKTVEAYTEDDAKELVIDSEYDDITIIEVSLIDE